MEFNNAQLYFRFRDDFEWLQEFNPAIAERVQQIAKSSATLIGQVEVSKFGEVGGTHLKFGHVCVELGQEIMQGSRRTRGTVTTAIHWALPDGGIGGDASSDGQELLAIKEIGGVWPDWIY